MLFVSPLLTVLVIVTIVLMMLFVKMCAGRSGKHFIGQQATAVRIIPVIGKHVGETIEWGGLLGLAPIMPVNKFSSERLVNRVGRIPAPIHSFKN